MEFTPFEPEHDLTAPAVVFPGQVEPQSAYRVAHDLLERRAPVEALAVLDDDAEGRLVVLDPDGRTLRGLLCLTGDRTGFCRS